MSGGVFSEKDGRQVPDTIAVTLEFPQDIVVTWQSDFSNSHYGPGRAHSGQRWDSRTTFRASRIWVTGRSESATRYLPRKRRIGPMVTALTGNTPDQNHNGQLHRLRAPVASSQNASVEIGYLSAVAGHMANLSYRQKERITWEMAKEIRQEM